MLRHSVQHGLKRPSSIFTRSFTIPFLPAIPQPPGNIVGTVNDAFVPPPIDKGHGSHHWTGERIVTIAMLPLTILPLATGHAGLVVDGVMSCLVLAHAQAGFQSCIIDYIPKRVYGKYHDYAMYLLYLGTLVSTVGVYKIETTTEGGVSGMVKDLFKA